MNSHEVFTHIHQGCFAGTGAIVRLPQCQWNKPGGYGKISQCITTTKHSKAVTVCIFLGIYCNQLGSKRISTLYAMVRLIVDGCPLGTIAACLGMTCLLFQEYFLSLAEGPITNTNICRSCPKYHLKFKIKNWDGNRKAKLMKWETCYTWNFLQSIHMTI